MAAIYDVEVCASANADRDFFDDAWCKRKHNGLYPRSHKQ
jgi:hypothetical protein